MSFLLTCLRDFRDVISPRYCAVCGARLNTTEQKLCAGCLMRLPYITMNDFFDNPICRLFWAKIPIEKGCSFMQYRHDSDSHLLLCQLKYNHRPDLGIAMGRMMARDLLARGFFSGIDCIVPVPLHWIRYMRRGYNQSLQLAYGVSEVTGLPVLKRAVVRQRNNESQTRKSDHERIQNVENLFLVKRPVAYHHVLLIDDVLTTGATLTACAKAILHVSPDVQISILTLAKA